MDFNYAHVPSGSFDDEETNPADLDPTIDDCMRMWRQGIEWFKHDTVFGVRQFAGQEAGFENAALDLWVESVQRLRAAGLFDADTSYNLLHFIVETGLDYEAYDVDPQLEEIGDRMFALRRRVAAVEARLQRDHIAERDRWYPLSADDKARLGIELSG